MGNNITTINKVSLSPYSKVKINWETLPENYSKSEKTKIINFFSKKYGIDKNNIKVIYYPVKFNEKGDIIPLDNLSTESIMDLNYQRNLMKEVINRDGRVVDFDRIIALDNKVNSELNVDLTISQHRKWSIKWLFINNFLSFGSDNYMSFSRVKGLTVVNSEPKNTGGKSTLTIDSIKFLLFGTTTKTDRNEEIFNTYSNKDEVVVRGMIDIEGDERIIERKMKRTAKKGGGWTVSNKINYYRLLSNGDEEILNEEDVKKTTKKLKDVIGSEADFELMVLATEKNLDDLIGLTTTESGKVLTRLIGLEVLELKETLARKMYNEFNSKKKSNNYDVITLSNEIVEHETKIIECDELSSLLQTKFETTKLDIIRLNGDNDNLINSKEKIDVTIETLNPSRLNGDIETLTAKGVSLKEKVLSIKDNIIKIGEVIFDEDRYHMLSKELSINTSNLAVKKAEVNRLKTVINGLIAGGICQSCNRKLDDVDNTEHINKHETQINVLLNEILTLDNLIIDINKEITLLNITKKLIDDKNKLELDVDRIEVEIGGLRNQVVAKMNDLKKYNLNLSAIELNKKVDIEISLVKTNLAVCEHTKEDTITKIQRVRTDVDTHKNNIITKSNLIETLKKEEEIEKIYKIYIDLVGKKGISKLVLRSVLPIINSEVQRLLEDVCDFEIEIFMDDKNDVQFLIVKDDITKSLKTGSGFEKTASSLALRCVLGKISTLPMPNFITFDEVLGKVADENIEKLKPLFDKIKDMYEIIFLISHNELIKNWGDNIVTVIKENNISTVSVK